MIDGDEHSLMRVRISEVRSMVLSGEDINDYIASCHELDDEQRAVLALYAWCGLETRARPRDVRLPRHL